MNSSFRPCAPVALNLALGLLLILPAVRAQQPRIVGFADTHNHQHANLAFGGNALVGDAFGSPEAALSADSDRSKHGKDHSQDILGCFVGGTCGWYPNSGYPEFTGWP